jgi:pimeloyl-ACP methyl ester carboxylesterase
MLILILCAAAAFLAALLAWAWTPDRPRSQLEARWLADPADMMDIGGQRLHVRDSGRNDPAADRPAIIMLHGFGASLHTWEPWAALLADRYRVIRYDLPGFGLSPPDRGGDFSVGRDIAVLGALMDALGLVRATLIGNSLGGKVAWQFAARFPARVDRLVLISPDGFAQAGRAYGEAPRVDSALRLMRIFLPKPLLRMNLAPAYADPMRLTDAVLTRYHDLMLAPGARAAMIGRLEQAVLDDPAGLLPRITAPTLLLWGERDRLIPVSNADDYLALMPSATLVRLPSVGHLPHEEAPAETLPALEAFLAQVRERPPGG